ncbi:replication-relaxation family protein [Paenibacillus alvei]|uniref:Replication-relaxation family protein n=1 Tax=Paenibacillus alvei TaxID=44250 RepID=A0ABT4H8K9_PAEAL|nr:replication-relaxation family protein [Paenibacillus alvei]EJW14329.1 hypothetical protein PAV_14c00220 [Paenibacillus alvei DSM 29]MCY9544716.1 replication-relaxation family protein [Paenibacillus alvei]MCY9737298.1 replication-relaxation family protein [Paenibacillus alvei]MCY9757166.1 replication-relaxation family protein [Paenibacillus alvei]MCY9764961.1 replication-relaxation family protein [Paenibacillus alvei]
MAKSEGNFLFIRDQEIDLLITLHDMIFLDIEYLENFIYQNISRRTIERKLIGLEKEGYIKSFFTPKADGERATNIKIITLDKLGVEEVKSLTGTVNWDKRWTKRSPSFIHHNISLANLRGAFYRDQKDDFKLVSWITERESYYQYAGRKDDVIVPDGTTVFHRKLNEKTAYFAYFMEMERSRQRISFSQNKLKRYNAYAGLKAHIKHPIFEIPPAITSVCFVSMAENEMMNLIEHTEKVSTNHLRTVMYSTYDKVMSDPMGKIWRFKGQDDGLYPMWTIFKKEEEKTE